MSRARTYPLATLRELREAARDEARESLAAAQRRLEEARNALQQAQAREVQAAQALAREEAQQAVALAQGMTAGEARAAEAYCLRLRADRERAHDALQAPQETLARREDAQRDARARLAGAEAELAAFSRHHERWQTEQERAATRDQEQEAEDIHGARSRTDAR